MEFKGPPVNTIQNKKDAVSIFTPSCSKIHFNTLAERHGPVISTPALYLGGCFQTSAWRSAIETELLMVSLSPSRQMQG
jgi:hypothetical protein